MAPTIQVLKMTYFKITDENVFKAANIMLIQANGYSGFTGFMPCCKTKSPEKRGFNTFNFCLYPAVADTALAYAVAVAALACQYFYVRAAFHFACGLVAFRSGGLPVVFH